MIDAIEQFLREDNWKYSIVGDENEIAKFTVNGENGSFDCFVITDEGAERMTCHVLCPVKAPPNKRVSVAELIVRINWSIVVGAFHLDFEDGEIKYKTAVPLGSDGTLTPGMARDAAMLSLITVDKYFPTLMSVVYSGISPVDALALVQDEE